MKNAGLDEAQAGIKTAGRKINNLTYADDTTIMAEREEELKSHLMKVKQESEKANLKLNLQNIGTIPTKNWLEGLVLQKNKEKEDSEIKWG